MNDKWKAAEVLRNHGYEAAVVKGVVLVKTVNNKTFAEITEILKSIDYNSSYGTTYQSVGVPKNAESEESKEK